MTGILRLSEASIIAFHAMLHVVRASGRTVTSHEIAVTYHLSEAHIAKIMQRLVRAGYLSSVRGPGGGFTATKAPDTITLREIYELIEGPLSNTTCFLDTQVCGGGENCIFGGLVGKLTGMIDSYMTNTTLAEAVRLSPEQERFHEA